MAPSQNSISVLMVNQACTLQPVYRLLQRHHAVPCPSLNYRWQLREIPGSNEIPDCWSVDERFERADAVGAVVSLDERLCHEQSQAVRKHRPGQFLLPGRKRIY